MARLGQVYRSEGLAGVLRQTQAKLRYLYTVATFRPHVIEKTLAGHRFQVAINNLFAKGWVEDRHDWPELEWIAQNMLRPGDVVVDCGANNGFTSVFFAKCVGPSGRVIAFEPLPSNAADVRKNIALNVLANVEVHQAAVGKVAGVATMIDAPNGIIGSFDGVAKVTVPVVPLDDALPGITPTFLKIDVEGYEVEVLRGARSVLAGAPRLDIEVHPIFSADPETHVKEVVEILDQLRYRLSIQPCIDGPIQPWDRNELTPTVLARTNVFHLYGFPNES